MKIAIGSDHRGDAATLALAEHLRGSGHEVTVCGACDGASRDYPELAWAVGRAVGTGTADRGILICGSGIGMSIAANKVAGVRAAVVASRHDAEMSRRHNDANVLCLSADKFAQTFVNEVTDLWLETSFEGGRHARRVRKIMAIERGDDPKDLCEER